MQRVDKGPYDAQARKRDVRGLFIIAGIAVLGSALFIFPFYELRTAIIPFLTIIASIIITTFLLVWLTRKIPAQTRRYPMYEHSTNWTTRLYVLIGTTEKHDLQIVRHRWSGKVEVSVDNEEHWVHEPKKSRDELNIGFKIGTSEVHEVMIKHNTLAQNGITLIIDGSIDYIF
jgi:hypothetical protein